MGQGKAFALDEKVSGPLRSHLTSPVKSGRMVVVLASWLKAHSKAGKAQRSGEKLRRRGN